MSHNRGHRRTRAEELSAMDVEDSEPTTGLTMGDLMNSPSPSVDPQQSPCVLASEHSDEPYAQAYGSQTAPSRVQSPNRMVGTSRTTTQGLSPSRLAGASGTAHRGSPSPPRVASIIATQGCYSPQGMEHGSESQSDPGRVSPNIRDTEEHFIIPAKEVVILRQEYSEFITLKDNAEVVLAEAMEATERLNTVFSRVRASMNRMSSRMKKLFIVPVNQVSGKTLEPGNNLVHDRAAAKAATQRIIDQTSMIEPAPRSGAEERARTTRSRVPGDRYSRTPLSRGIHENIPHPARGEQSDDSQARHGHEVHTVYARDTRDECVTAQSRTRFVRDLRVTEGTRVSSTESTRLRRDASRIDMNALREEIKETISATIKEKLCSDADSVTTVSQSMQALDANAQYWSNLSNKAARHSRRALELQLKLAEEKVNNLLHEEAPEEALLEAAREACTIRFQLDQNSADTRRNIASPSRNYGKNPISEPHVPPSEVNAPFGRQSTPALSINAQLDGAVVDMTSEYSGIQQMVRQVLKNASHEEEPEKSFLAKAGVKMGNPPTYNGERNLEKFETWVANVLQYMSMYNLLGPQAGKIQIQFLGQCLVDEAQEWFYRQGNMTVQQLHQELTKLAKQMVELPNAYSYRRRFMDVLKPSIREEVLGKGFTAEFTKIDVLVEQAVTLDNAKRYTTGYNSSYDSAYLHKPANTATNRASIYLDPHSTSGPPL
ncbi:hypothetical protein M422DRAFT_265106 [Sphaerobolus stellatus SS14]|uniref:Retrotransposon gag domain-containing protein n=1 Tax=Sphaerobolus stellatus (strain SS14) TaxID=990650 RepID=A0A0C9UUX5_SPHS4|nr:hypothetical protein M422DRAFT_265106 [Sphaerobolus stellatus SS14]